MHWRMKQFIDWGRDKATDALLAFSTKRYPLPPDLAAKRLLLVGASVGQAWRLHLAFPRLRALDLYQFDKSPRVREAIALRPDAIVIKECAAYFPIDGVQRDLVLKWLTQIRAAAMRPALATVVPVTRAHAAGAPGRAAALWAFNDWLRELAAREEVPLLDLEAALCVSREDRHLQERLAAADGLHLRRSTYRDHLDPLIPPLLERLFHG